VHGACSAVPKMRVTQWLVSGVRDVGRAGRRRRAVRRRRRRRGTWRSSAPRRCGCRSARTARRCPTPRRCRPEACACIRLRVLYACAYACAFMQQTCIHARTKVRALARAHARMRRHRHSRNILHAHSCVHARARARAPPRARTLTCTGAAGLAAAQPRGGGRWAGADAAAELPVPRLRPQGDTPAV
jgi:hypothetical protein